MKIHVYNGEYFDRSKRWYLWFWGVVMIIIVASVRYENIIWAVVMLLILGGYLYMQTRIHQQVELELQQDAIRIGQRKLAYSALKGFVVEVEKMSGELRNLVFVGEKTKEILTFKDTRDHIEVFLIQLQQILPQLEMHEQSNVDKLLRKCKI